MPELLRIKTEDYLFTIKASSIARSRQELAKTLLNRDSSEEYTVKLMPAVTLIEPPKLHADGQATLNLNQSQLVSNEIKLIEPLFFENTLYQFEWIFLKNIETAQLTHRSQNVCEAFIFSPSEEGVNARLTGSINTGNNVGWMRLPLSYQYTGNSYLRKVTQHIAFEVLPTKMALHQDLPVMYKAIDQTFPLWRFSLVEKTEQDASKGNIRGSFPLMWLANFNQIRAIFEQGLKVICQAPNSRLQPQVTQIKAAKLKGRISHKLGERVKQDFANGQFEKHYRIEKKQLSVDTFENRFIKMVVTNSKKKLSDFEQHLRTSNQVPDKQKLSDVFLDELHHWQQPLQKVLSQSFMKEVGKYTEQNGGSLVLQQKTGYSAIYKVWQELKFYLNVFSNQSSLSIKSVADIYEVWCFLCIKKILEQLGFEQVLKKVELSENSFFEYQLKDGFAGAFEFKRVDGVKARLAHEPKFTTQGVSIRSYLVTQEPDIVLEVTVPRSGTDKNEKKFIWLFDAKYRIKTKKNRFDGEQDDNKDFVPNDAINQMHRYRDALFQLSNQDKARGKVNKSRPVFGAFALYPGYFDQEKEDNPYQVAIDEIGIGAFALLPRELPSLLDKHSSMAINSNNGHTWLFNFLAAQIGNSSVQSVRYNKGNMAEQLYVQEAARIPYHGMKQVLYSDLTMTIALGAQKGRNDEYFNGFEQGTAQWYHTKQAPMQKLNAGVGKHIIEEIRYLAIASASKKDPSYKEITKLWPVKVVKLLPRYDITEKQSGVGSSSDELYYLFELGRPLTLQNSITKVPQRRFSDSIKLTTLNKLESVTKFSDIEWVYK